MLCDCRQKQRFRYSNFSKRQPSDATGHFRAWISRTRLRRQTEFCVVRNEPLLAGQHKSLAALLSGIGDGTANQAHRHSRVCGLLRQGIDAENHLPCTVFVVHIGVFVHFIGQIRLVRDKPTSTNAISFVGVIQQPEVIAVILDRSTNSARLPLSAGGSSGFCRGDGNNVFSSA